ncbi:mediator of RNA polymerase II transcription subunit 7 [Phyllosticta citribraziliensis]|uniref:Mediator of RNA polymerase II transcription subunit 7 n=1 Tax=Phyllosticta citribraziliensis TaxID=989973 RepID=A0ABR1LI41_9PEZI
MADEDAENVLSTQWPAPPPFWKHFTPENRARLKELQEASHGEDTLMTGSEDAHKTNDLKPSDLPPELRYLVPPAPPASGKYRSFGDQYDINAQLPSLKDMGMEQLYPSPAEPISPSGTTTSQQTLDRASYLKRMTQSLLLNFLEYVGLLSINPSEWANKFKDLDTLLVNCHSLINEYRPHQARASLIMMMEDQLRRKREEVEGVKKMGDKIEAVLAGLGKESVDVGEVTEENGARADADELRRKQQRAIFRALDGELAVD